MPKTYPTKNDLPEATRVEVTALLNAILADGIDLRLQAKQAHWNVKGPHFLQLHELFDSVYEESGGWNDMVAERAVQLGGIAEGTLQVVGQKSRLAAYPVELTSGREHVDKLSDALAAYGKSVRAAIDTADKAGDADTSDLFTEVSRGVDKLVWFLEAHLQG